MDFESIAMDERGDIALLLARGGLRVRSRAHQATQ
jgi:hypothetical protein